MGSGHCSEPRGRAPLVGPEDGGAVGYDRPGVAADLIAAPAAARVVRVVVGQRRDRVARVDLVGVRHGVAALLRAQNGGVVVGREKAGKQHGRT